MNAIRKNETASYTAIGQIETLSRHEQADVPGCKEYAGAPGWHEYANAPGCHKQADAPGLHEHTGVPAHHEHTDARGVEPYDHSYGIGYQVGHSDWSPYARVNRLRRTFLDRPYDIDVERGRLFTEAFRAHEKDSAKIRRFHRHLPPWRL